VGDSIVHMKGWSYGEQITKAGERWKASELGLLIASDIFGTRAPGLRY
jgi:hypothetical protein